jgi:hypothetical protein
MKKPFTSLLAATSMLCLSSVFNTEADSDVAIPQANAENGYIVWASDETRESLGWIVPRLGEWAGMNVVVLGASDLPRNPAPALIVQLAGRGYTSHVYTQNIAREWASATVRKLQPETNGPEPLCVISTFPPDYTAHDFASRLTFIPLDRNALAGQTGRDWNAIIMGHETRHCNDLATGAYSKMSPLQGEVVADQQGLNDAFALHKEYKINPAVFDSWVAMRSIGTFTRLCERTMHGVHHATAAALHVPHAGNPAPFSGPLEPHDITPVYTEIIRRAGLAQDPAPENEKICRLTQNEPAKLYGIMQAMLADQTFEAGSLQQQMISGFLSAVGRYARTHFHLGPARPAI